MRFLVIILLLSTNCYSQSFFEQFPVDSCEIKLSDCRTNNMTYLKVINLYKTLTEAKDNKIFDMQKEIAAKDTEILAENALLSIQQIDARDNDDHIKWLKTERFLLFITTIICGTLYLSK